MHGSFDALVVTALLDELEAVLALGDRGAEGWTELLDPRGFRYHHRTFARAGAPPLRVAAAWLGAMGPTAAAVRSIDLVQFLRPACLSMCGICAGRRGEVFLGDVIIADRVFSYDHGKVIAATSSDGKRDAELFHDITTYNLKRGWAMGAEYFARKFASSTGLASARPPSLMSQRSWLLRATFAHAEKRGPAPHEHPERTSRCPRWKPVLDALKADGLLRIKDAALGLTREGRRRVQAEALEHPDGAPVDPPFRVHVGPIATGTAVQQDPEIFHRLEKLSRKTLGIEMEAAALGYVASYAEVPSFIVKSVSDFADGDKDDHFRQFACRAAAECALAFLMAHVGVPATVPTPLPPPVITAAIVPESTPPDGEYPGETAPPGPALPVTDRREDWGDAVEVPLLYGRDAELSELERSVVDDRCRVVGIVGMGGIGKTSLVIRLAERVRDRFSYVFFRDLRNAPLASEIVTECVKFLSHQTQSSFSPRFQDQLATLMEQLAAKRCLLVLDNFETVLRPLAPAGELRDGYADYGALIRRIAARGHDSCLLITSRELLHELSSPAPRKRVRTRTLTGLGTQAGAQLLEERGLSGSLDEVAAVVARYSGNPLALNQVSSTIESLFGGRISAFIEGGSATFGDIRDLLAEQYARLSPLERELLEWIAAAREPISLEELRGDLARPALAGDVLEAMHSLKARFLVEKAQDLRFTVQPVVLEFVTDHLIELAVQELSSGELSLLNRLALMKADAKEHVREHQARLLLQPILEQLGSRMSPSRVESVLLAALAAIRAKGREQGMYAAGNVINLLATLWGRLDRLDLSGLTIRQARFAGVPARQSSFARSVFSRSTFTEAFGSVLALSFCPRGELLAAGTSDATVRVLRAADGQQVALCEGHDDWVKAVAFSPDGQRIVSGGDDQTLRIWDAASGQLLSTLRGHRRPVLSVAFGGDGLLVSSSSDNTTRLWDAESGVCRVVLEGHTDWVRAIALGPGLLATGSGDRTLRIWELASGRCVGVLEGHTDRIWSVAWSADGKRLVSGGDDRTIRLWDLASRRCIQVLRGHTARVRGVAFCPGSELLASASEDWTVRLWSIPLGECTRTLQGHTDWVWSIAVSPSGEIIASGGGDRSLRLWDTGSGHPLRILRGHSSPVWYAEMSPDGTRLAGCSGDGPLHVWDPQTGACTATLAGHTDRVHAVAFAPDGKTLASGSDDTTVRLWSADTGEGIRSFRGHHSWVRSVAFHPQGHLLASGSGDGTVRLWDVASAQCMRILVGHEDAVWSVAFRPGGAQIASAGGDQVVRLWDVQTGAPIRVLAGHQGLVRAVRFDPKGELIASAGVDRTVRLFSVDSGEQVRVLHGHGDRVYAVAWRIDGTLLCSGAGDRTIRLWDALSGACVRVLEGHGDRVWHVAFSPDGRLIVSASDDETLRLWDTATGVLLRQVRIPRPYEGANFAGAAGLSTLTRATLRALGAVE